MYRHLLFDADNTLLDFNEGERCALREALSDSPLEFSDEVYRKYHLINDSLWKDLELGKIQRDRLRVLRFEYLFNDFGLDGTLYAPKMDEIFLERMRYQSQLFDGVEDVLKYLFERYSLYIVTNASVKVQRFRLSRTCFHKYFKKYYISEEIGAHKPQKEFFDKVVIDINDDISSFLVIGDSLSSDIKGAEISGIDSCYLDHLGKGAGSYNPKYIINDSRDLINIL